MNDEIRFDVDVNVLWHGDTMEVIGNVVPSLSSRIESEIAQHFEVDLSDLREYIRLKQEGGEIAAVVRCQHCKHRFKNSCDSVEFYECDHMGLGQTRVGVKDDFFCADGERRPE